MRAAIRRHDKQRLITVGLFPLFGSVDAAGLAPGRIAPQVDFISVHLYPQSGTVHKDLELLRQYKTGLPILLEETYPLQCGIDDYGQFLRGSRDIVDGWLSFYWGEPQTDGPNVEVPAQAAPKESVNALRAFKQELMNPPVTVVR